MKNRFLITALAIPFLLPIHSFAQKKKSQTVTESAREIPLAFDVDVVVVGGTTRGVAAAVAAAEQGASVFLAASRPYLGEDMCATYRLWLEDGEEPNSPLGKAIYSAALSHQPSAPLRPSLPFTYTSDKKPSKKHPDNKKNSRLFDGLRNSASADSLQYDEDVNLVVDLGKPVEVARLSLMTYQRPNGFAVGELRVATSDDGKQWKEVATTKNNGWGGAEDKTVDLMAAVDATTRYLQLSLSKAQGCERMLLAELHIEDGTVALQKPEATAEKPLAVTTPMQVKSSLDDALLKAKVDFLYGSYLGDILRDKEGRFAGITIVNRSGRQAVRAKVLIDATDRAVAARLVGATFADYPAGPQPFERIVLGGDPGKGAKPLNVNFYIGGKVVKAYRYDLDLPMKDSSWTSFARADQEARNPKLADQPGCGVRRTLPGSSRSPQCPGKAVRRLARGRQGRPQCPASRGNGCRLCPRRTSRCLPRSCRDPHAPAARNRFGKPCRQGRRQRCQVA